MPKLDFFYGSNETGLESLCQKVLGCFRLPHQSLICIFDNMERPEFTRCFGEGCCGFFYPTQFPTSALGFDFRLPSDIIERLRDSQDRTYDILIYLTHRVCQSTTGTVITIAHELQHFMQYGFSYKVYMANDAIRQIRTIKENNSLPWGLPAEHEAVLASKKVSEEVLGKDSVLGYAEQQKEAGKHKNDWRESEKWSFFLASDPQESFDFLEQTKPLVDQNRKALVEQFPVCNSEEPDFTKENWWE